ncbi:hypothetical protein D3C85_809140 [compost metagenome]
MPCARKAQADWPAVPCSWMWMVSSGKPAWPYFFATSPDSMVPTVRFKLRTGEMNETRSPFSSAARACAISL